MQRIYYYHIGSLTPWRAGAVRSLSISISFTTAASSHEPLVHLWRQECLMMYLIAGGDIIQDLIPRLLVDKIRRFVHSHSHFETLTGYIIFMDFYYIESRNTICKDISGPGEITRHCRCRMKASSGATIRGGAPRPGGRCQLGFFAARTLFAAARIASGTFLFFSRIARSFTLKLVTRVMPMPGGVLGLLTRARLML